MHWWKRRMELHRLHFRVFISFDLHLNKKRKRNDRRICEQVVLSAYRKRENDMVSERQIQADSGTDYDNLSSTPNTDTDEKTIAAENVYEESGSSQRSSSSTPTILHCDREETSEMPKSPNTTTTTTTSTTTDANCATKTIEYRCCRSAFSTSTSKRPYKIIDSNVSQRLLQLAAAEKMAAASYSTEKNLRTLRRKASFIVGVPKLPSYQNQQQFLSTARQSTNEEKLQRALTRTHFDVVRTASFGGNPSRHLFKEPDSNRNSLPLSVLALNFDIRESDELETSVATKDKCSGNPKMGTVVEGRFTTVSSNGKPPTDEDTESLQRLSFVSSSTGYSSARSSLRSSEIGEDVPSFQARDFSIERRLLTRETSLSEPRRQKLLKSGNPSQLDRIAMELLDTERCYVNDLNDIIQGYLNFFIDHREEFQMTVDDVSNTFGCIERIFIFNRRLYHQLDAALLNVALMAKCFIDNMDGFKDYVTYCTNYQKMVDTLSVLMKNNMVVETLALRQTILGHSLPLSAYLLKPVQRVLKYHLFMENILKNAIEARDISDTDRALISEALSCMTKQAEKINEEKKRVEHWERVKELQSALHRWCSDDGEDLSKYGDLILEGTFKLAGSKTNRQLFLFEEMLMIVKERNGALICKDYIMCSNIMLNESISADPLAFQVLSFDNPKVQYAFLATSIEQKRQWMKELKRMMLDHYTVEIPERTKLLMLNMDTTNPKSFVINPDHDETVYGGKGTKRIPKYLDKRRKSVDANTTVRRSQRRDRSNSRTRSTSRVSKASSTGSLIPVLSAVNIGLVPKETPTACTCNSENNVTPSTSGFTTKSIASNGVFSGASVVPFAAVDNSANAISSMFARRKSHDTSRSKILNAKKRNGFLPPLPSATTMRITAGSTSDETTAHNCAKRKDQNLASHSHFKTSKSCAKCTCNATESTPLQEPSAGISSSSSSSANVSSPTPNEHIENTFAELYKELNLLATNADNVVEKSKLVETTATTQKCDVRQLRTSRNIPSSSPITANTIYDESSDRERRERSKSLGRFEDVISTSTPIPDSPLVVAVADQSSEAFVVEPIDNDSEIFMNGSDFAKLLDDKMKYHESDSDEIDEDDVPKGINWTESPAVRNRLNNVPSNVHHRRRSSQVAEQVWRLRHKNAMNKNVENCVDAKSFSSYTAPNNLPLRVTVTEYQTRKSSAPSIISPPYGKLAQPDRRFSSGLQLARQRTPLTVEQCAQLNEVLLDPSLGVVKEMVKQIEKPSRYAGAQITSSSHKLLT